MRLRFAAWTGATEAWRETHNRNSSANTYPPPAEQESATMSLSLPSRDTIELGRLPLEQPAIEPARPDRQHGMRALLDDPAVIEHQDAIEAAHRRQPMRDHDRGASLHQPLHRLLDQRLGFRIE